MIPPEGPVWTRRSGLVAGTVLIVSLAPFGFALWVTGTYLDMGAAAELGADAIVIVPFVLVGCGAGMALTAAVNAYADVSLVIAPGNLPTHPRLALLANVAALDRDLRVVVTTSLQPEGVTLWLRGAGKART